jgi:D-3-phosphoglycerate dehydrogenase
MVVLIADNFEESGINGLKGLGCEVLYRPALQDQALAEAVGATRASVLVVRSTPVSAAAMAGDLKLIIRAGSGYNTIDVTAATRHGILVANCPGRNAIAVAELAFGLMLAIDRRIPDNVAELRAGRWNKKEYTRARGLFGSTLGLLGVGHIGQEMIRRAAGFGLPVVLWSRRFDGQDRAMSPVEAESLGLAAACREIQVTLAPTPEDVADRCDILSLHIPLAAKTKKMINAHLLERLKPGAMLINTARGDLVDYDALLDAVRRRGLRVGLDVYEDEPAESTGSFSHPVLHEPLVYGTHHIGASTSQAQEAIAAETVRIVSTFMKTGKAPNAIN